MSYLDLGVLAIMLISGLLAMVRGFVREVLSIASWALAAFAAWMFYPRLLPMAKQYISNDMVATAAVIAGIFLITLIIVSLITVRISDAVLDSRIGFIDRTLGFLYGLVRGIVPVVVAFMIFEFLVPQASGRPAWVNNARTLPMLETASNWVKAQLPAELVDDLLKGLKKPKTDAAPPQETVPPAPTATPAPAPASQSAPAPAAQPTPKPQAPSSSAPPTAPQQQKKQ